MNDTIYRRDAIQALVDTEEIKGFAYKMLEDRLIGLPSANKWIPCSERLPEEKKGVYLICTEDGYICSCRWTNVNPFWADLTTEWHWCKFDIPQYNEAVAWMELKPWKGADDE